MTEIYKLLDFYNVNKSHNFIKILTTKWDKLHFMDDSIFRYKIDKKLEERSIDGIFLLQLNPNRRDKRRTPEELHSVYQPFDGNKFNFTKVSPAELLFSIEDRVSDIHTVLVNVSPISRYHSLLCPSVYKCLPQVATAESLALAVEVLFLAQDRNLRILFNSLCGFASVNHLHYHLFMESNDLFVEKVKWERVKGDIFKLDESYPVPAFCFKINKDVIVQKCNEIYKILDYFLKKSLAHNILLTRRCRIREDLDLDGAVNVIIWPRRSTTGAKQFTAINVAVLELSGWFPVYDIDSFTKLTADDLRNEIIKWKIGDFDKLCEEIKSL